MNVQYEQQGNYLIPCVKTKKQEEIHLGVWANPSQAIPKAES